jgi:hypothetical protein
MPFSKSGPGSRSVAPPKAAQSAAEKQKTASASEGTVYFEFISAGSSVRVTPIDAKTGIEATIIGPANAARAQLERTALAKLRYVLNRAK